MNFASESGKRQGKSIGINPRKSALNFDFML